MPTYHWTLLAEDTRVNAGARAMIKRAYRRWLKQDEQGHPHNPHTDLERWARAHPTALQFNLEHLHRRSAKAWEVAQDGGLTPFQRQELNDEHRWKGEDHDAVCSVLGIKVDWPGLCPSYNLPGAGDYHSTESVLHALVPRIIRIEGRQWWRRAGHHVFTARVWINGREVLTIEGQGGSNTYYWEAWRALGKRGLVPYRPRDSYSPGRWCSENGVTLSDSCETMARKRDLHKVD